MDPYVLGIDIGTGSVKAVAVGIDGNVSNSSQKYYGTHHPQPGYSEQDPLAILDAFIELIRETVQKMEAAPQVISLSSAMHSLVAVDEEGSALSPLMLWSDSRSASMAQALKRSKKAEDIYRTTGTPIHSMSPLCKIMWLQEHQPQWVQRAFKFISIKEFVWYKLFHEFRIDHSLASGTGLFDIQKLKWHKASLKIAGITAERLSQPVSTGYVRNGIDPSIASQLRLSESTLFCIGASDGCMANLGSNSIKRGTAAITIGTSGAVRIARSKPLRNFSIMNFNYILDEKNFICGGPVNNGGNVLQWLMDQFLPGENLSDPSQIFEKAEKIPAGCDGLIFLPYLHGERAPVWDDQSCGVFFGIRSEHGQSHFIRAALEGVCFALKQILSLLEEASGPIQQVNVSGGFIHSYFWVQMLADITEKKNLPPTE